MIGFDNVAHPLEMLPLESSQHAKASSLMAAVSLLMMAGRPLPSFQDQVYDNSSEGLPSFAKLDFEAIPVSCHKSTMLHQFVVA